MKYFKKAKKFVKHPCFFLRDFFNNKYPVVNCEQNYYENEEAALLRIGDKLTELEGRIKSRENFDVDVVFTWVDSKDTTWQDKFQLYQSITDIAKLGLYADDHSRFDNHNELYYSISSIRQYLPWVRKIFIVTDEQTPSWLSDFDSIIMIDHKDIIDSEYLPTFNSHVIEAFLYRIPELSENFIYFNDDVFVGKPAEKEHFFQKNNLASIFVADKSLLAMCNRGLLTPTLSASLKSQALLKDHYGFDIDSPLVHTYVPLKKSTYKEAWDIFETEIRKFTVNKFRTNNDLNMATFLVPWMMYCSGQSVFKTDICYYFNIRSNHAINQYKRLLVRKKYGDTPDSICANDFNSLSSGTLNHAKELQKTLDKYYFG